MTTEKYCNELRKFVAPEIVFGAGARKYAADYAANLGAKNILLVSDNGVCIAGWTDEIRSNITDAGLECNLFTSITSNPRDTEVMQGFACYEENGCDAIIAVGGGSVVDAAKGIAIIANNGGNILEYEGVDTISEPVAPLICLPTTAGAAADVSQFAIVTNTTNHNKIAIISKAIVPDVSLIDCETTHTMEAYLTACTGMDVLTHAIEAYVSNASSPITDIHALKAISTVFQNLKTAVENPDDAQARYWMSFACMEAGLAFSNASLGAVHAMAHSLGGMLDMPHGECNAILLENVIDFNFRCSICRYTEIAEQIGVQTSGMTDDEICKALLEKIRNLRLSIGISDSHPLKDIAQADISNLAAKAVADACLITNPRLANQNEIERLYEKLT